MHWMKTIVLAKVKDYWEEVTKCLKFVHIWIDFQD